MLKGVGVGGLSTVKMLCRWGAGALAGESLWLSEDAAMTATVTNV